MKAVFWVLSLSIFPFFGSVLNAQVATFFESEAPKDADQNYEFGLTSASNSQAKMTFSPIYDDVIDIEIVMLFKEKEVKEEDFFSVKIGTNNAVELRVYPKTDQQTLMQNGKESPTNWVGGYGFGEIKGFQSRIAQFRLRKSEVQSIQIGEIGGYFFGESLSVNTRHIEVGASAGSETRGKVNLYKDLFPKLSCFAKSGLKLREESNLSAQQLDLIPYNTEILVLEDYMDGDLFHQKPVNTKGNLKVGYLESKMVKVLYNGKVGYAYGGYLYPFTPWETSMSEDYLLKIGDWMATNVQYDLIKDNKEVVYQHLKLNFNIEQYAGLSPSQRIFLTAHLFPDAYSEEELLKLSKRDKIERDENEGIQDAGDEAYSTLMYENGVLQSFAVERFKKDLFQRNGQDIRKTTFVTASQLNLRKTPSLTKGEIIGKLPLRSQVEIISDEGADDEVVAGIQGKMVKIRHEGKEGYVFDGFLSPLEPLYFIEGNSMADVHAMLDKSIRNSELEHWEHSMDFMYDQRNYCKRPHYSINWVVVPASDKFQLVRSLKTYYKELDLVSFKWDETNKRYAVESASPKVEVTVTDKSWCFSIVDNDGYSTKMIVIETLDMHLQKLGFTDEFLGD